MKKFNSMHQLMNIEKVNEFNFLKEKFEEFW